MLKHTPINSLKIKTLAFFFALLLTFSAWGASLKVTVDKQRISKDDYIVLTLQLINSDTRLRGEGINPNVDLTLLAKDFDVGNPKTTFRYRMERTHGRATSELKVALFPKQFGNIKIPGFMIDGLSSKPIPIHVNQVKNIKSAPIFIESGWIKKPTWQGQTSLLYLDLFHRVPLKAASFGGLLDSEPTDVFLEKLLDSERTEQRHGETYQVTRSSWAITFNRKKYDFFIPDIWVETAAGKRRHFPVKKEAITVKSLPKEIPDNILINEPTLSIEYPPIATVGELFTWTVQIKTNNHASKLPHKIPLPNRLHGDRLFHGATNKQTTLVDQQPITVARYPISLIPNDTGEINLPIIKIPYFDPQSNSIQYSQTEVKHVKVNPQQQNKNITLNPSPSIEKDTPPQAPAAPQSIPTDHLILWKISSTFFLALWLITLFLLRKKNAPTASPTTRIPRQENHPLKDRLLTLLQSRTIEEGIQHWVERYGAWPELEQIARRIQQQCYSTHSVDIDPLKKEFHLIEREINRMRKQNSQKQTVSWEERILDNSV